MTIVNIPEYVLEPLRSHMSEQYSLELSDEALVKIIDQSDSCVLMRDMHIRQQQAEPERSMHSLLNKHYKKLGLRLPKPLNEHFKSRRK